MKLSLGSKLVLSFIGVSIITYGTSAFFIFYLKAYLATAMSDWLYVSIILLMGITWSGILGFVISKFLTKPIVNLSKAAKRVSDGDLMVDIPERREEDEIKVLNDAFRVMVTNIKDIINDISNNTTTTSHNAENLSQSITEATSQIESMAAVADDIYHGVGKQRESSESSLQTAEQMLGSFQEMKEKSSHMRELSSNMEQSVEATKHIFSSLKSGMSTLADSQTQAEQTVRLLDHQASDIGAVTGTVKELAEQTHLLALNASIEAAHAGEHGAGFAVVATEIRKLAEQSNDSAQKIHSLIMAVQSQIHDTVQLIHNQNELVQNETSNTHKVESTLIEFANVVYEFMSAVQGMEHSITEQTDRVELTYQNVHTIRQMADKFYEGAKQISMATHEETAIMEEISSSSDELSMMTSRLLEKTKAFSL
ncbi:methyl-accepting chemotaxis protein [Paenibacillus kyungheensis]|uniref:Methyl-accepting chemotaxis protein n=1 Tax=Paenibacillus kyungheensis TaxID=1452732 RepID=A0AAX3M8F2_9BACL|nr:methyl-accepting chemotaxis protein [Paenibacillus kyungheensis]WCT57666.1 methyl-accepting chemotaxis protein [Paenibacillus kyungheensis]